jgi:hypothetical protein
MVAILTRLLFAIIIAISIALEMKVEPAYFKIEIFHLQLLKEKYFLPE